MWQCHDVLGEAAGRGASPAGDAIASVGRLTLTGQLVCRSHMFVDLIGIKTQSALSLFQLSSMFATHCPFVGTHV